MRMLPIVAAGTAVAISSCSASSIPDTPSPRAQQELAEALAGRSPGPARQCIRNYRANNMRVIDDSTILFRDGRTIYLQKPESPCSGLTNGSRTLVTRKFGTTDNCAGDINRLVDLTTGIQGGACVFGPFIPYTRPS